MLDIEEQQFKRTLAEGLRHYDKTVEYLEKALSIEKTAAVQDFLARVKPLTVKNG